MSYTSIDPIINWWKERHHLNLYTKYQDNEVRAARLSDSQGRIYAIGIEEPDKEGFVKVRANAWDFKKRRKDWNVPTDQLEQVLEEAIQTVKLWME